MTAWSKGAVQVQRLIVEQKLQRVPAARSAAPVSLERARTLLVSARTLLPTDPDSAFVLAYDAARQAGAAVLAQQALRATAKGGHITVEQVLRAQFEPGFAMYSYLRRRRNELEYPAAGLSGMSSAQEAETAIVDAASIVDEAAQVLPHLDAF